MTDGPSQVKPESRAPGPAMAVRNPQADRRRLALLVKVASSAGDVPDCRPSVPARSRTRGSAPPVRDRSFRSRRSSWRSHHSTRSQPCPDAVRG